MNTAPTSIELSVIVPVYNEEKTIASVMHALPQALPQAEIVYVNDGSLDGSLGILKKTARPQDIVLTKENGGKGSAIRMGLEKVQGAYTVIQDADLEYDPKEILHLLETAKKHPGAVIFGSRFLQKNPTRYRRFLLGNKVMSACLNILYGSRITDSYTCYKLLPTDIFRSLHLESRGFEMEAEICARCLKKKIPIHEIPISYSPRTIEEGKKINWKDAVRGVITMLRIRLKE